MKRIHPLVALCYLIVAAGASVSVVQAQGTPKIKFEKYTLPNGLEVILHEDHSTPIVAVDTWYHVGSGDEQVGRTGFAHLFEHIMFMGSQHVPVGAFDQMLEAAGADNNGSTTEDRTNYYETLPSNALPLALWLDSDRMGFLLPTMDLAKVNLQRDVVKNERRQRVDNQPYGRADEVILAALYPKSHPYSWPVIGSMTDLSAASLTDVQNFFKTYYAPNNAVLAIAGDFDPTRTMALVQQYFGDIPRVPQPPKPDLTEPRQTTERRVAKVDSLATRPALAIGYHMPPRNTPEYYAMGLIDQILLQGKDSRLYQSLVQQHGLTGDVSGGINLLGNMFDYDGPMLWIADLFHDPQVSTDSILRVFDATVEQLRTTPVDQATLDRALTKTRSSFYDIIEGSGGLGRADLLASFALFDNDPGEINRLESQFAKVTPALIQQTAQEYLRPSNRTVLTIETKKGS